MIVIPTQEESHISEIPFNRFFASLSFALNERKNFSKYIFNICHSERSEGISVLRLLHFVRSDILIFSLPY